MYAAKYNSIHNYIANGTLPDTYSSTESNFVRECRSYAINARNQLTRRGLIVARYAERAELFKQYHSSHSGSYSDYKNSLTLSLGRDITWKKIKSRYYWRGGQKYVAEHVSRCVACSHKNNQLWKAGLPKLKAIPVHPQVFWRVHVDLLGPLTETLNGNKYVALGVCAFSKYVEAAGKIQIKNMIIKADLYLRDLKLLEHPSPLKLTDKEVIQDINLL